MILTLCSYYFLYVHSYNGKLLRKLQMDKIIHDMKISPDGKVFVTGDSGGGIVMRDIFSLEVVKCFELPTRVRSVTFSHEGDFLFAGLENGDFYILSLWT